MLSIFFFPLSGIYAIASKTMGVAPTYSFPGLYIDGNASCCNK